VTVLIITGLMLAVVVVAIVRYGLGKTSDYEINLHCGLIWLGIGGQTACWHQQRWVAILDAVVAGLYLWTWWRKRESSKA
jgi:hypothetical protein